MIPKLSTACLLLFVLYNYVYSQQPPEPTKTTVDRLLSASMIGVWPLNSRFPNMNAFLDSLAGIGAFFYEVGVPSYVNPFNENKMPSATLQHHATLLNWKAIEAQSSALVLSPDTDSWTILMAFREWDRNISGTLIGFNSATSNFGFTVDIISTETTSTFTIRGRDNGQFAEAVAPLSAVTGTRLVVLTWDAATRNFTFVHDNSTILSVILNENDASNTSPLFAKPHMNGKMRLGQPVNNDAAPPNAILHSCLGIYKSALNKTMQDLHFSLCEPISNDPNVYMPYLIRYLVAKGMVGMWPMTRSFGLANAIPQFSLAGQNKGVIIGKQTLTYEKGPNTGIEKYNRRAADTQSAILLDKQALTFTSPAFEFFSSPITVAFFWQSSSNFSGAMFAFNSNDAPSGFACRKPTFNQITMETKTNVSLINSFSSSPSAPYGNSFSFSWDQSRLVLDYAIGTSRINNNATTTTYPTGAGTIYLNMRYLAEGASAVASSFSCFSVYKSYMTYGERVATQALCQMIQSVVCSESCIDCQFALTWPYFACQSCKPGWTGPTCLTKVFSCSAYCKDGYCVQNNSSPTKGSCTQCKDGYSGPECNDTSTSTFQSFENFRNATNMVALFPFNVHHQLNNILAPLRPATALVSFPNDANATYTQGPFGNASAAFLASHWTDSEIDIPDITIDQYSTSFTIILWYRENQTFSTSRDLQPIFSFKSGSTTGLRAFHYVGSNIRRVVFQPADSSASTNLNCNVTDQWVKIAFSWNHLNRTYDAYCQSLMVSTDALVDQMPSNFPKPPRLGGLMRLRGIAHNTHSPLPSHLACLSIYHSALTKQEIEDSDKYCIKANGFECQHSSPTGCRFDYSQPAGYRYFNCVNANFTGPTCRPNCGGQCQPDRCIAVPGSNTAVRCEKCMPGYGGNLCQDIICGNCGPGTCVPGWCLCPDGSVAKQCHKITKKSDFEIEFRANQRTVCNDKGLNSKECYFEEI